MSIYRCAASSTWTDEDGREMPAGDVHAWEPGKNATVCGLPLHRARLRRLSGVDFTDALPESGGAADVVGHLCPRCRAGALGRRSGGKGWDRTSPRP